MITDISSGICFLTLLAKVMKLSFVIRTLVKTFFAIIVGIGKTLSSPLLKEVI